MKVLFLITLLPFFLLGEKPPPPEYPYPKDFGKGNKEISEIEKPVKIDKSGVYHYLKKRKKKKPKIHDGIQKPYKIGSDGVYYYSTKNIKKKKGLSGKIEKSKK